MNRIHFTGNKFERRFHENTHQGRRSRRLFVMINHVEFASFPVAIRRGELGGGGYQKTPVAVSPETGQNSTINSL
jgi:hypothetical protein